MNKRGNIDDIMFLGIILFFIGIVSFVGVFTFNEISERLKVTEVFNSSPVAVGVLEDAESRITMLDYFVLAVLVGFLLAIVITGYFIGGNALFMVIYFVVGAVLVFVGMVLSNVWENIVNSSAFGLTISSFGVSNHIISYLPIYLSVAIFLGLVSMFAKPYVGVGGGGEV